MSQTHLSGGQVGISPGSHRVQADFCCSWYFLFSISSQHERKCLWAKCICVRNIQRRNYFLWHTEPKHAFKGPNNITTHPGCNQQTRRIPTLGQRGRQPGPSHSEETTEKREEEVVKNMTDNREGRNRGQRSEVNHSESTNLCVGRDLMRRPWGETSGLRTSEGPLRSVLRSKVHQLLKP